MTVSKQLGATPHPDGSTSFRVWAPLARQVELGLGHGADAQRLPMVRDPDSDDGEFTLRVPDCGPEARYGFHVDDGPLLPDPCSRRQPDGVHAPAAVFDTEFDWQDSGWRGPSLDSLVIYELHVGTFTAEGTFDAIHDHLERLAGLGVTAIELMPVASFPGPRNWGYDGVLPFAAQESYGGPRALQRLVDAAHRHGLAVLLDVVYNHLGPEGNRLREFGPYFTDTFATPWGDALNFDGPYSDGVRGYFLANALQWIEDFHIDGLRLDAIHAIHDRSARPFLEDLTARVQARGTELGRRVLVIGETDQNDPRYVAPRDRGGQGMDAIWCDDLHHALHVAVSGETDGYYEDFADLESLAEAWCHGMTYRGRYSPFRRRRHGREDPPCDPSCLITCTQNHDQIGNRLLGDRLTTSAGQAQQRLATLTLLSSATTPLLFMGEEYGSERPFRYFTSHGDAALVAAVRAGRQREFEAFGWRTTPPDPQAEDTFAECRIDHDAGDAERAAWLRDLLRLRASSPRGRGHVVARSGRCLALGRGDDTTDSALLVVLNFAANVGELELTTTAGVWHMASSTRDVGIDDCLPKTLDGDRDVKLALGPWQGALYVRR